MRSIRVSEEVWNEIAKRGEFGQTEDDVLRQVFDIEDRADGATRFGAGGSSSSRSDPAGNQFAVRKMHAGVHGNQLVVMFHDDGTEQRWELPAKSDKSVIRQIRDEAVKFALSNGASDPGQTNYVRKALTDSGYHLMK